MRKFRALILLTIVGLGLGFQPYATSQEHSPPPQEDETEHFESRFLGADFVDITVPDNWKAQAVCSNRQCTTFTVKMMNEQGTRRMVLNGVKKFK